MLKIVDPMDLNLLMCYTWTNDDDPSFQSTLNTSMDVTCMCKVIHGPKGDI